MDTKKFFKYSALPLFDEGEVSKLIGKFTNVTLDLTKITKEVMLDFVELIEEFKSANPTFSIEDETTWSGNEQTYNDLETLILDFIEEHNLTLTMAMGESIAKKVAINEIASDAQITDVVMHQLDDNMVQLLYCLATEDCSGDYDPAMRTKLLADLKKNREKSPAGKVFLSSKYFESFGKKVSQKWIIENLGFNTAYRLQTSYPFAMAKAGKAMYAIKEGKAVKIYEDTFNLSDKKNGIEMMACNLKVGNTSYIQLIPRTTKDVDKIDDKFQSRENYAQTLEAFFANRSLNMGFEPDNVAAGMVFSIDSDAFDNFKKNNVII